MKTMKYILLVICVARASAMIAVDYKLYQTSSATLKSTSPMIQHNRSIDSSNQIVVHQSGMQNHVTVSTESFRSTSVMPFIGSTLSTAGPVIAVDESEIESITGPKRARPEDWDDPYKNPIGEGLIPLLILAVGYIINIARRKRTLEATMQ